MLLYHSAPKTAGGIRRKSCRGKHDTCIVSPPVFRRREFFFRAQKFTPEVKPLPNAKVLSEKQAIVEELTKRIGNATAGVLVDYKGITVLEDTALRRELRAAGIEYTVVKNTLLRFAVDKCNLNEFDSVLNGKPFGQNVYAQKTPAEVFEAVAHRKNAIGIIGAGWLSSDMSGRELSEEEIARLENGADTTSIASFSTDVKVLKVAPKDSPIAYYPDQYNIFKGTYPFHRQIYLISTASPATVGHSFYSFVTSNVGQKIILASGVCPKVITPQFVDVVKPQ